MILDDYARALAFAAKAHEGQVRTSTTIPYIYHPISVSALVLQFGGDEAQAIGGLLHDVVEDCGVTRSTITNQFGHRVAAIVEGCTDGEPDAQGEKSPWLPRKRAYLRHLEEASADVLIVSACDKLHNVRSIIEDLRHIGGAVFDRFSATPARTVWYYRSLAEVFTRRLDQPDIVRALQHEIQGLVDFEATLTGDIARGSVN